jgi:hypothetical protein
MQIQVAAQYGYIARDRLTIVNRYRSEQHGDVALDASMHPHRTERARNIPGAFAFADGDVIPKADSAIVGSGEGRRDRGKEEESVGKVQSAH